MRLDDGNRAFELLKRVTGVYYGMYYELQEFNLINNNCHHFANTISMVLCSNICPDWCTRML